MAANEVGRATADRHVGPVAAEHAADGWGEGGGRGFGGHLERVTLLLIPWKWR